MLIITNMAAENITIPMITGKSYLRMESTHSKPIPGHENMYSTKNAPLRSMATELPILLFTVRQVKNCQDGLL